MKYIVPPKATIGDTYCHCQQGEEGYMVECGKCKNWFHDSCINHTQTELNHILIYFCTCCLKNNTNLKIVYKDYSKEHTKPLFNKHDILTVYNLYPYHILLEMYKILKFRIPYCIYEFFTFINANSNNLLIQIPNVILRCQKQVFSYQGILFWNKLYKQILIPSKVKLHADHTTKLNLLDSVCIFFDFSTQVCTFKSKLKNILLIIQSSGDDISWSPANYLSNM